MTSRGNVRRMAPLALALILAAWITIPMPTWGQPPICGMEKLDALRAKMDFAYAKQKGVPAPDPDRAISELNVCLKAHGLPLEQTSTQSLLEQYLREIQASVQANWTRPKDLPQAACKVSIIQEPGGRVVSVDVEPDCPYNESGRMSVVDAVKKAQPLPYKGFESVFRYTVIFTFVP